jgi:hypothetical protein
VVRFRANATNPLSDLGHVFSISTLAESFKTAQFRYLEEGVLQFSTLIEE